MEIIVLLIGIFGFAFTIILHEVAHGWMADRLGDPTARLSGRLTLNPIPHIDFFGSVLLPFLLITIHSPFIFGWAKPVPIDPYNLKNPKKDSATISLAGPLANIIFAIILSVVYRFVPDQIISGLILLIIKFNIALAVFNLIPVYPLDGKGVLTGILPDKAAREFDYFMNKFGLIILAFIILPIFGGISLISYFLYPIISFILNILIPGLGTI